MLKNANEIFAASLKRILEKKMLDHITVKDIAKDCGVTRQTFYYHFTDIYQLVEWEYKRIISEGAAGHYDINTWQQGYCQVLMNMRENKLLFTNAYRSVRKEFLETFMYNVLYEFVYPMVEIQAKGMAVDAEHKAFIAHFYCLSLVATDLDWVKNGMKEDPYELTDQVATLIKGGYGRALVKYSKYALHEARPDVRSAAASE